MVTNLSKMVSIYQKLSNKNFSGQKFGRNWSIDNFMKSLNISFYIFRLPAYVKGVPKRLNSTDSPLPPEVISQSNSQQTSQQRARRSSSSSASNSSDEIKTSSRMTTRSKTSRRRRQSSSSSSSSSSEQRNSRRKLRRSWRKPSDRSRSPIQSSRVRTPSKQQRQVEERRVVYVGRISENTSRADLRKRFEVFGPIEEISVHFRDRG